MILIGAALGRYVDLRRTATELRWVNTGLDLEFLEGFSRRIDHVGIEVGVGIFNAIESEAVEIVAHAGNGNILIGTVPALATVGLPSGGETKTHVGCKAGERKIVATVERKFNNSFLLDDGTNRGVFGLQGTRRRGHLNRLADLSQLHHDVDADAGLHLDLDIGLAIGLEANLVDFDAVCTGDKAWEGIKAFAICNCCTRGVRAGVGNRYVCASNGRALLVIHRARDVTQSLGEDGGGK